MAFDYTDATDAILSKLRTAWIAGSPALTGGPVPVFVTEIEEPDLTPHPKDTGLPWMRAVVRHNDASKVSLNGDAGTGRYRRIGLAWAQVFVPGTSAKGYTLAEKLGQLAQGAWEGKRAGAVVFKKVALISRPKEGPWWVFDVKADFYWDQIK